MNAWIQNLALRTALAAATLVAVISWLRGVSPLVQSFRAVVCGLAVYGCLRAGASIIGRMVLRRYVTSRAGGPEGAARGGAPIQDTGAQRTRPAA